MLWNLRNFSLDLRSQTALMGVLNLTPDSFSDGGSWTKFDDAVSHGLQMATEGALILDIGGESTRPGAEPVSEDQELQRVIPVIKALAKRTSAWISIDTRKPTVAAKALEAGASIINDVGGLQDPAMRSLVAQTGAGAIVMHMQGTPETMQQSPRYEDVVSEVRSFFCRTLALCSADAIQPEQLVFDPGIGFGKTVPHNLELLRNLQELRVSNRPLALGVSRKSFLSKITGNEAIKDRFWPTVALSSYARARGVSLLRVHDVLPNFQSVRMTEAILEGAA